MNKLMLIAALLPTTALGDEIYGSVDFLNGWRLNDGSYQTAVDFILGEGWKTYWRAPGPAGIPPSFDWSGSANIADIEIIWPTPKVFETYGMVSIGYKGPVTLPIRITPIDPNVEVTVNLALDFGVCSDICVPARARFSTNLGNLPDNGVQTIRTALTSTPSTTGIRTNSCSLTPNGNGFDIVADLKMSGNLGEVTTIIEYENPDIWIDIAKTSIEGRNLTATATMEYYGDGMLSVDRSNIRITVISDHSATEVLGCPAA